MSFKSGTVALVGKPNVGKSTLVNALVGHKVSIVSSKPQTTRRSVMGVDRQETHEIVFVDTPGLHEPHTRLGRMMVEATRQALTDLDLVLVVVDGSRKSDDEDQRLATLVVGHFPLYLCMNKMDLLRPEMVVPNVEAFTKLFGTEHYMLTTATQGTNLDLLRQEILSRLEEGEPRFDEDTYTDQTLRFMAAELIREKVLLKTRQEVPHATAVVVIDWTEEEALVRIAAEIIVEKPGQKAILIGKGGQFVREVGTEARQEIQQLVGRAVHLDLFVKVREDWRMNLRMLHDMGLDS